MPPRSGTLATPADKPASLCIYRGPLAWALRHAGQITEALAEANEAMRLVASHGRPEEGESLIRLAYAAALHAACEHAEAQRAIADAEQRVRDAPAKISDPERRRSFLEDVPEHAQTLAQARAWGI